MRDVLLRLDGVGDLTIFGERQYSLRVWLDPEKLAGFGLTAGDVVRAIQEQNVQVSGGALGQQPAPADNAFQLIVTTQGRFEDPRQFRQVIVRSTADGRLVRVQDVARVELGAQDYFTNSYLNGKPAVALAIFQRPGTNALQAASQIITTMQSLTARSRSERLVFIDETCASTNMAPPAAAARREGRACAPASRTATGRPPPSLPRCGSTGIAAPCVLDGPINRRALPRLRRAGPRPGAAAR